MQVIRKHTIQPQKYNLTECMQFIRKRAIQPQAYDSATEVLLLTMRNFVADPWPVMNNFTGNAYIFIMNDLNLLGKK